MGIEILYNITNGCVLLTNTYCPLVSKDIVNLVYQVQISEYYPTVSISVISISKIFLVIISIYCIQIVWKY